jgi:hypothetical protein
MRVLIVTSLLIGFAASAHDHCGEATLTMPLLAGHAFHSRAWEKASAAPPRRPLRQLESSQCAMDT